ncbi:MAG: group II intron reverse transcriptase/maturase [archaeon]
MFEYLMRFKEKYPQRKFYQLIDKVYDKDNLKESWTKVKSNMGCAGIDKESILDFWSQKDQKFSEIERQLRNDSYTPLPVLRKCIPKSNGKLRPLGIPIVKDRVIQQATKNVIEQIFEAKFMNCSYGFRPSRNAHQAVTQIMEYLNQGFTWVVDADIKSFFDNVDHDILMRLVAEEIADGKILNLIEQWLKAGVMNEGRLEATEVGTPQGGVISPLLANIYLHEMDKVISAFPNVKLIRYADDFVILCKTKWMANQMMAVVNKAIVNLKLELNSEKTRIVNSKEDTFEFLGFCFGFNRGKLAIKPRQKSLIKFKDTVKIMTKRHNPLKPKDMIYRLNRVIRGWGNYFKIACCTSLFKQLDVWIRTRCRTFIEKRKSRYANSRLPNIVLKREYKLASLITLVSSFPDKGQ